MGRILFVTTGTSAIENRKLWEGNGDLDNALPPDGDWGEMIRAAEAAHRKEFTRNGKLPKDAWDKIESRVRHDHSDFEKAVVELHRKFWGRSEHYRREYSKRTSAEAISTWLAGKEKRMEGGPLQAGADQVVLVASRTCIGQMAARINREIFREALFHGDGERSVVIEKVDDLTLEGITEKGDGAQSLSDQVREIYDKHAVSNPRTALFNITGGFKGLIPAITVICSKTSRTMLYLHETMDETVQLRFRDGWVDEESGGLHVD